MKSKIWTNGDTSILLRRKHFGKRRNCSLRAISPFPSMFSKAVCCEWVKMSIYGVKLFPKQQISKLEGFADGNFRFDKNWQEFF